MAVGGSLHQLHAQAAEEGMALCNSSYKIGCVDPRGFQQLLADRVFSKRKSLSDNLILVSAFSRLMSLVQVLLCYNEEQ